MKADTAARWHSRKTSVAPWRISMSQQNLLFLSRERKYQTIRARCPASDQVFPNQTIKESHPMRNHYGGADRVSHGNQSISRLPRRQ